jgi:nicotinamidase-related amidase
MPRDFLSEFAPKAELDPATTCLVLVDLQYASGCRTTGLGKLLTEEGREEDGAYRYDRIEQVVVPTVVKLLDAFRSADLRRVFVTYGSEAEDYSDVGPQLRSIVEWMNNKEGEREHEILDEIKPLPGEKVVNKFTSSAFQSSELGYLLHHWGVKTCVFSGVSTQMCVESTVRDASDLGYDCVVVEDACGSDRQSLHDASCEVMARHFAVILSADEVLDRLGVRVTVEA